MTNQFGGIPVNQTPEKKQSGAPTQNMFGGIPVSQPVRAEMGLSDKAIGALHQFAYKANMTMAALLDLPAETINGFLAQAGIEERIPTIGGAIDKYAGESNLPEGMLKDVSGAMGQGATIGLGFAGGMARAGQAIPAAMPSDTAMRGTLRQVTQMNPQLAALETGLGAAAGGGAEYGRQEHGDTGELIGGLAAPLVGSGLYAVARPLVSKAAQMGKSLISPRQAAPSHGLSPEAARTIQDQMTALGFTPDEVMREVKFLGGKGMLADVDPSLAQATRNIVNQDPVLSGQINRDLMQRSQGAPARVSESMSGALRLGNRDLFEEISVLDNTLQPKIKAFYTEASQTPIDLSPRLEKMIKEPEGHFKTARLKADKMSATRKAAGEELTYFDELDEFKKSLDDMIGTAIRQGNNNQARSLVQAKNALLSEVDAVAPAYKQGREMYAGKQSMMTAAELGMEALKPNVMARDVAESVKHMSMHEKEFFKLGVQQGLRDQIEKNQINRDILKSMFNKGGTMSKLRVVFDDDKAFNEFRDTLDREARFQMSKNTIQGNSSTAMQIEQMDLAKEKLNMLLDPDVSWWGKAKGMVKKSDAEKKMIREREIAKARKEVGTFLTTEGIEPERVRALLQEGRERELKSVFDATMQKYPWYTKLPRPEPIAGAILETRE